MAALTRGVALVDQWQEPTAPTKTDAIAGSVMGCEYVVDDLPPAPEPSRVARWPLVVSLVCNAVLLALVVRLVAGR